MPLTAHTWPIAAALLPFVPERLGASSPDEERGRWARTFREVAEAGFEHVDLTDTWLPFGDLDRRQTSEMASTLSEAGLSAPSMSVIRRSVIDEADGDDHLAYSHRCIDVAAELGVGVVSVGLHRPLTAAQRGRLWFWTAEGHRDRPDDTDAWDLAVRRFSELGRHAEDAGLLLSLEMYEHTFLGSGESAVRLVEEIGSDAVGLNPDVGNIVRLHEPVEDWRELLRATLPYANYWHVKNYTRDEDPDAGFVSTVPTYLESGVIDYRTAMRMALDSGFRGVICTEHYGGDGLSMSAANREYLRERILPRDPVTGEGRSRVRQQLAAGAEA
jgi:sugar phosphate isomerase/epimerase